MENQMDIREEVWDSMLTADEKRRRRLKLCACAGLDRVRRAVHINGHREQSKVHKQIRPFSAPVHAGARRSISVLVGCGILTLPDEKNSLAKPTALHRGGEIEQMKKCFLTLQRSL